MNRSTPLPSGTWQLDPAATVVEVSVKKLGILNVPASLAVVSGQIEIGDDSTVGRVDVVVDASSYASKNAKRNEHVVGSDFLDANAFPTISFAADAVATGSAGYKATGTITIKGQTSPIDVSISNVKVDDSSGSFTATATVDRTAIGVAKLPTFIVGRMLQLTVTAVATKI